MGTSDKTQIVLLDNETRNDFEKALSAAIRLSNGVMDTPATRSTAIASQLLAQNAITGLSIASFIDPVRKTNIPGLPSNSKVYDLSSLFILTRGLIEAYLTLFYIAVEPIADSKRDFRLLWWDWHEINERLWALERMGSTNAKLDIYRKSKGELISKISTHPEYSLLPPGLKKEFEKNKRPKEASFMTKAEIAETAGIHPNQFQVIYKLCSQYTHAQPLAVSVLLGLSTVSPELPSLFRVATRQATSYLLFTVRDFIKIFPAGQRFVERDFLTWVDFWADIHATDLSAVEPRNPNSG